MSRPLRGLAASAMAGTLMLSCLAAAQPAVTPIRFAPGASAGEVSGGVERGGRTIYAFGARAGQTLDLRVEAVEQNAAVQIYQPGAALPAGDPAGPIAGQALPGAGEGDDADHWRGRLPRSGTYIIVVGSTRGGTTYRLRLSIT